MSVLDVVILSVLQGFTEFLPISSSGHLVLGEALLGLHTSDVSLEIFLHFGTFLSVLVIFWRDIFNILAGFFGNITKVGQWRQNYSHDNHFASSIQIIASMIPAGFAGIYLKDFFESLFDSVPTVGLALIITGLLLFISHWAIEKKSRMSLPGAITLGIVQALAIVPGISRSGSTISTGMLLGFRKEEVARFSFIMALPVVFGATLLEFKDVIGTSIDWSLVSIGVLASFISGIIAIKWLLRLLIKGKFSVFSYYCVIIGFIALTFG